MAVAISRYFPVRRLFQYLPFAAFGLFILYITGTLIDTVVFYEYGYDINEPVNGDFDQQEPPDYEVNKQLEEFFKLADTSNLTESEDSGKETLRTGSPVKVVLLSYMRGGSTFLGEIFSRHPRGYYYFEPMDGMYNTLYGTGPSFKDLDIMFYTNHTWRNKPEYELEYLSRSMLNILNCDMMHSPIGIFLHHFFENVNKHRRNKFLACKAHLRMKNKAAKPKKRGCIYVINRKLCPRYFQDSNLYSCYENTWHVNEERGLYGMPPGGFKLKNLRRNPYERFRKCNLERIENLAECLPLAQEGCEGTVVRAMKVIRLSMETVEKLLQKDPSVKIIHYTRDPRGIVMSRSGRLTNKLSAGNDVIEGKYLCEFMLRNTEMMSKLQQKYKKSFLHIKYEDLASNLEDLSKQIYSFLNLDLPPNVIKWINMSSNPFGKERRFGTIRKNATATANAWISKIPPDVAKVLCSECSEVLDKLNYDRIHC